MNSRACLLLALGFAAPAIDTMAQEEPKPLPAALVEALNKTSGGPHAGFRANHAKGVMATGTFTPSTKAKSLSKAPHFMKPVPVTVRFSNGTGVPNMPDADPNASPHGMATRFHLADGSTTDIVAISANSFPVSTPEDFLALLQAVAASGPDAAKPTPIEKFLSMHPAAMKFVTTPRPAPESFGTLAFFGVNAFKFTNAKGQASYIRYQILPVAGERALPENAGPAPNFLMEELPTRLAKAPVKFRLLAQVANEGDKVNDPTEVWPASNKVIELGVITLNKAVKDQSEAQRQILYNPVALPAGIEPSEDPVLAMRFPAYAVSYGQRQK
jgi:catalase